MSSSNTLLIAPPPSHPKTHTSPPFSAPSAPGIHDTLRSNTNTPLHPLQQSSHPLESRLALWTQTAQNLHYTLLKRNYGLAAPLIREMELGIVRGGEGVGSAEVRFGPGMGLGSVGGGWGRSVHEDVLLGRDWEVDGWGDVFGGGDHWAPLEDFHGAMERRMGMNW